MLPRLILDQSEAAEELSSKRVFILQEVQTYFLLLKKKLTSTMINRLLALIAFILVSGACAEVLTREKILAVREFRHKTLKESVSRLERQLQKYENGEPLTYPDQHLSLAGRVEKYRSQINEVSQPLTEEQIQQLIDEASEL